MSIRTRRPLGALAAAALSCLSVVGLQATAASAAEATASHECYLDGVRVPCTPDELLPIPEHPELPDRSTPTLPPREYDPSSPRFPSDKTENEYDFGPSPAGAEAGAVQLASTDHGGFPHDPLADVDYGPSDTISWCKNAETGSIFPCGFIRNG